MGGLDTILEIGAVAGAIAAIAGALAGVYRYAVKPVVQSAAKITELDGKVELIVHELGNNGGASLRDSVDRIEHLVMIGERRNRALLQDASNGILEMDQDGGVVWVNRTYLRWAGRSLEEFKGDGWVNSIDPTDRQRLEREWQAAVKSQRDNFTVYKLRTATGKVIDMRAQTYAIADRAGKVVGWVSIAQPIGDFSNRRRSSDLPLSDHI